MNDKQIPPHEYIATHEYLTLVALIREIQELSKRVDVLLAEKEAK